MPYNHQLYLANCRKMIVLNEQQVAKTKATIERTGSPQRKAELQEELAGWEEWVETWKQRLKDAESISN